MTEKAPEADYPPHILKMLRLFQARWPKHPVTDDTMLVYSVALMDVPEPALVVASMQLLRTAQWFPGVDEIRDLAAGPKSAQKSPEEAWEEVIGQIRKEGYYGRPQFSSHAIARSVEAIGGWNNVASQLTESVPANRAHFMRCYASIAKSEKRELEYAGAKEIVSHMAGLLGGGPKQLYGEDYVDPIEDQEPNDEGEPE